MLSQCFSLFSRVEGIMAVPSCHKYCLYQHLGVCHHCLVRPTTRRFCSTWFWRGEQSSSTTITGAEGLGTQWIRALALPIGEPNLNHQCWAQWQVTVTPVLGDRDRWILGACWPVSLVKIATFGFSKGPCLKGPRRRKREHCTPSSGFRMPPPRMCVCERERGGEMKRGKDKK